MHLEKTLRRIPSPTAILITLCLAGFATPNANADLEKEFGALVEQLEVEHHLYLTQHNHTHDTGNHVKNNQKDSHDPRIAILTQMDNLIEKNATHPDAADMAITLLDWSVEVGTPTSPARLEIFARHFPTFDQLTVELEYLEDIYLDAGDAGVWRAAAEKLLQATSDVDIKRAARFFIGRTYMDSDQLSKANATFQSLARDAGDAIVGQRAKRFSYDVEHLQVGMVAPEIQATALDGTKISLQALRGQAVLLVFWATWCPPCVAEIPVLAKAVAQLSNVPLTIVAVSLDDEREMMEALLKSMDFPATHSWNSAGRDHPTSQQYNVEILPSWWLIDPKGVIRMRGRGQPFDEKLLAEAKAILKNK